MRTEDDMDLGLAGRTALVTGASGAIGSAIAAALAREGAAVALGWHTNQAAAETVATRIASDGGRAVAVRVDMADPASAGATVAEVTDTLGPVAALVANAVHWPLEGDEVSALSAGLERNVLGTMALIDAVLPGMRQVGWGRLVLISSDIVAQPMPGLTAYPASKAALEAAARALAVREAAAGILTNVVRPGFTLTDKALSSPRLGQRAVDAESARTPTGRICTPDDVASAVAYLSSAANGHINGQTLSVAGGRELTR
ncbi:SDR family NAD(P)-dependent oxidoreductase [Geodermatophilus sp. SYSU D00700]